ncbi:MAG: sulfotransferase [Planctomycetota bacterium]
MPSPILILGMHRSGTSMLTSMLADLGLFLGKRLDSNHESTFFQGLNDWVLRSAGGSWERPEAIDELLTKPKLRGLTRDYLDGMLRSPRVASFLGLAAYLKHRRPMELPGPWGFKDPRTTFTLPLWLELFPDARVVHVRRHGVDVASSLKTRQERSLAHAAEVHAKRRGLYWLRPKRGGFAHTVRALTLAGGFALWEEYMREADRHLAQLGERACDVRYEDFLAAPERELTRAAEFCGLTPSADEVRRITAGVRPDRAFAWRKDDELVRFGAEVEARLAECGYSAQAKSAALA